MKKKFYSLLFASLLSAGVLAGCNTGNEDGKDQKSQEKNESQTEQKEEALFPVTIKDAADKEVVIDQKPERIVTLIPSNTEIAFELGLNEEIVGVSDNDNYPEEVASKEKVGGMEFNIEKIISLKPDLVLAHESSAQNAEQGLQQLRDAGTDVLVVNDAKAINEVYGSIEMIGKATGQREEAEKTVETMKAKFDEIKAKAAAIEESERKKVLVEVSPEPEIYTTGKNTFMDEMITMINAENIYNNSEGWVKIDPEATIQRNPDVIITTYGFYTEKPVEKVLARKAWQNVTAVKEKQVIDVDSDMVTRSGPRLAEGVEELAKAIYPDVFTE
ncbi:ABC transporter substrate-binding protein [Peribacillus saganii]|uniref:ABC transporter substrate-binding protein n=1 Tax=Peribacillus saganii TaxID=2303992 RepID=A0A372LV10_9BACI|nr:helical backbone metal receptor [Peribacillus saganii]RFU71404.1 ABC transporter substrate-binding protein [Peribacillus saganii]